MKVSDLIRKFCEENSDKYEVYEGYSGRFMFGRTCLGVIVKMGYSEIEFIIKLTDYLNNYLDVIDLEFAEGISMDNLGLDTIVYFPKLKD